MPVRKSTVRTAPARTPGTPRPATARPTTASARAAAADLGADSAPASALTAPKKPVARARPTKAVGASTPARESAAGEAVSSAPAATPRTPSARTAAARATAARTAAAKSESAVKSGVARAGAAKATATKTSSAKASAAKASAAKASAAKAAAVRAAALQASTGRLVPEPAGSGDDSSAGAAASVVDGVPFVADVPLALEVADVPLAADVPLVAVAPVRVEPVVEPVADPHAVESVVVESVVVEPVVAEPKRPASNRTPRKSAVAPVAPTDPAAPIVLAVSGLRKSFGQTVAVAGVDLEVRTGSFYGIVGPNGAGKTTTLSMITGLLRPDEGSVTINGIDVWGSPIAAKRLIGVLPDRLRLFDRLTGAQLIYYSGVLRGLDAVTVRKRSADLAVAFGLEEALNRLVADYSAGMTKKIALACAMIHSPRLLVLDEPFESVDPVSAVNVTEILQKYVASGGTVVLSSHGMDMIQRVCDHVAIIVQGAVLASGTVDEVRGESTLEERFIELAGGRKVAEGMEWLHSFSD
ncbi:ATP-binding cassette domain-containing protein [Cryobacterium sp. TMT2-10]|uniref:ATP-binding cassette domain-containing protein n=2 Tax=Cryobacterium TaxID=69578 RepID=A0AAQ2C7N4_9MICO|nr:ABC transporter ATP-binding protein [Cryobacterium sp. TMT4-10]TFC50194.1 ATP-binding cassette domain-containing protein [Cryobacterium shii]TFC83184.1 ATP-binding cassette domain-containing protein [Cryobacterium sp. TmT2-59]TFD24987.1 ATP-binding cassette domain-containing protein [Cryobacterium sp. TMT2-23]TFD40104.1 ATP-binding cassette domain-containing protein [Cryobacterium sp. TMT2-10]TFD17967.1 ATP-binding cassette domain-containing protein [Cryobacterium sp. TMT4-10]